MKYTFWNWDYFGNGSEFDITPEHYFDILSFCFAHGKYFSLVFWYGSVENFEPLESWRVPNPGFPFQNETFPEKRRFYRCCSESFHFLTDVATSIFEYDVPNPEDIVFYREDGTVILDSVAHEGECSIFPMQHEDVSQILKHGHWLHMKGGDVFSEGTPCAPAKEHQLEPSSSWNVLNEPLFIRLQKIQHSSVDSHKIQTVEELTALIDDICDDIKRLMTGNHPLPAIIGYNPKWYVAFKLYVLGECGANTDDSIADALAKAGFCAQNGVCRFFTLLDQFIDLYLSKTGMKAKDGFLP